MNLLAKTSLAMVFQAAKIGKLHPRLVIIVWFP